MIHKSESSGLIIGLIIFITGMAVIFISASHIEKETTNNTQKEQLYHKQIEKDICGKDTLYEVCFIPDSIWYKHH